MPPAVPEEPHGGLVAVLAVHPLAEQRDQYGEERHEDRANQTATSGVVDIEHAVFPGRAVLLGDELQVERLLVAEHGRNTNG